MTINIASQFSKYPGGRFETDGPYSGELFRNDLLAPALKSATEVIVQMDGALGYGSSFLEEAFGGLVRESGFTAEYLDKALQIATDNDATSVRIRQYIREARE